MSEAQIRRLRRKKKAARNVRRTIVGIITAPAKMPRVTAQMAERIMRICEVVAVLFVAVLALHLSRPNIFGVVPVVIVGILFAGMLMIIKLSDYQDKLEEYNLYGFRL